MPLAPRLRPQNKPAAKDLLAFVNQRVYAMESCRNLEIVAHALKKIRDLLLLMSKTTDRQLEILTTLDNEADSLRNPECKF